MDPFGNKEDNVGLYKFMKFMATVIPGIVARRGLSAGKQPKMLTPRSGSGDFLRKLRNRRMDSKKPVPEIDLAPSSPESWAI